MNKPKLEYLLNKVNKYRIEEGINITGHYVCKVCNKHGITFHNAAGPRPWFEFKICALEVVEQVVSHYKYEHPFEWSVIKTKYNLEDEDNDPVL